MKYSVSKLLLWLVHTHFPIQDQYTYKSRENKQQKQLRYRIFHLEDTECEWMNEAKKMRKMLFPVMKHSSVQNVFKLFIMFHYFQSVTVCYSINQYLLSNIQITMKLKGYQNRLTKVQAITRVKIVLGVEWFQTESRGFVLYECNETLVVGICKMEELFSVFFSLIYLL